MGMMVLIAYRCQLNAGLNVKIVDIPIKTWEDVLASDKKLLMWINTTDDAYFYNNPKGQLIWFDLIPLTRQLYTPKKPSNQVQSRGRFMTRRLKLLTSMNI